jgi:glycosyltransferase involved in cell wall biosynthesis
MGNRIRVLQLIESEGPGGAEKVVLDLASYLDPEVYSPLAGLMHKGWLHDQLRVNGIEVVHIDNRRAFDLGLLWQLVRLIRHYRVDLIHAHEFTMNIYGAAAAFLTGKVSLATIHGMGYYPDKRRRLAAYRLVAAMPSTRLVAVSGFLRDFFCGQTGVNPGRVLTIANGVDLSRFNGSVVPRAERNPQRPRIGTLGSLYPVKGHLYLIRAAARVLRHHPGAQFVIAGKETSYKEELQAEAEKLGVGANMQFLPFQEDVPSFLHPLDVFVLPSLQETFSIALIEAMAAGLPVVSTRCGGPEELMMAGENGYLVQPEDDEDLADKILQLLADSDRARRFGEHGRKLAASHFSMDKMITNYQAAYSALLNPLEENRFLVGSSKEADVANSGAG